MAADYNPNSPQILGQEWCPIREESLILTPAPTTSERGYAFTLPSATMVGDARFYLTDWTNPGSVLDQSYGINIYPRGSEALSGPIKRVLIPVSNATTTGSPSPSSGSGVVIALSSPDDFNYINFNINNANSTQTVDLYFNTNAYSNELSGKRILGVNFLYGMSGGISTATEDFTSQGGSMDFTLKWGSQFTGQFFTFGQYTTAFSTSFTTQDITTNLVGDFTNLNPRNFPIGRLSLGNTNVLWSTAAGTLNSESLPWTYTDLQRFEFTNANRYAIRITQRQPGGVSQNGYLLAFHYSALEILYCEETRVAVGGSYLGFFPNVYLDVATNRVPLRNLARVVNPVLAADDYVMTVYRSTVYDSCETSIFIAPSAPLNALRELYSIPSLAGVDITVPAPPDDTVVDKVFTSEQTKIIPQLSLHATGGSVVTTIHPYGREAKAPVYGSIFAAQEVQDSVVGGSGTASYPWVRFYARRFGNTSVPLQIASAELPGSTASITPSDFDALPEILDGWKEVTLPLATPAVMGSIAGEPNWVWTATNETAGNRWEVLGAWAPAVSAIPGNLLTLSSNQLSNATYDGTTSQLMWLQFNNSAVSGDGTADATLLFSQYPPSVSGFTANTLNQTLTYTTPNCAVDPGCIPRAMGYNKLSWTLKQGTSVDTFSRVAVSGWGSADTGQAYTLLGSAGQYGVNGSYGFHTHLAGATTATQSTIDVGSPDVDEKVSFLIDAIDTAGTQSIILLARRTDNSNFYRAIFTANTDQSIRFAVSKRVAGVDADLMVVNPLQNVYHNPLTWYTMRFRVSGQKIQAKVWPTNLPEPNIWTISTTDSSLTTGNTVGLGSNDNSAAGSLTVYFDNFLVSPPTFGGLEIQRFDPVDGAFSTIMMASNPAITGFNDYEARVGQPSVYRMREINSYDFTGLWSPMVTATVTSPGVTGASIGLTLFTSNFVQLGTRNLAYSSEWESNPQESFTWPEGRGITLQEMYNKNFPTAFHSLEREGEQFTRDILVNAAGIPPATSENGFESLRDLGWADLPYVCVRDELGNRWYAAVLVPEGNRRRMKAAGHLNVATVNVIETTDTPYPVDP